MGATVKSVGPVRDSFLEWISPPVVRRTVLCLAFIASWIVFYVRCIPPPDDAFVDLPSFYAASVAVFRDHVSPYDVDRLSRINGAEFRTFPFLYPPPSLLLFEPLSLLTLDEAKVAVTAGNHLLVLVVVFLMPMFICNLTTRERYWSFSLCLLYPLFSYPLIHTVRYGQVNVLLLAALVGFWIAAQRRRSAIAGLCLSVAVLCKTFPFLIVPMLLAIGRWRESVFTIGFLALFSAVAALFLPSEVWSDWLFQVAPSGAYMREPVGLFPPSEIWNQSLNGLIARHVSTMSWLDPAVHGPFIGQVLCYGGVAVLFLVSLMLIRKVRHSPDAIDVMMPVALPVIFLAAPFSWEHHGAYLLPAIVFLLSYYANARSVARSSLAVISIVTAVALAVGSLMFYRFGTVVSLWLLALYVVWERSPGRVGTRRLE